MNKVGEIERITQNRVVKLFSEILDYHYLGNWEDRDNNRNIEEDILKEYLEKEGYSNELIKRALTFLKNTNENQSKSLYDVNRDVYSLLRYDIKVKGEVSDKTETVRLINWKEPNKNHFAIAEEVTVKGVHDKRPDVVLYVNGIALAIIELKRSTVSVSEGIRQNLDNQKKIFIEHFFTTIQFVTAGNDTEGLRYGTIETSEKYFLKWKEVNEEQNINNPYLLEITKTIRKLADNQSNLLDKHLIQIFNKERFLELIHNFIVFDRGIKKICRHNQYFAVKAAQNRIRLNDGGIIWHTQGSGKSLIMVWLTKWIRENIDDARVVVITDRTELDDQIEKVYKGVDENIYRTKSGKDLISELNKKEQWLICSLIHKFFNKEEGEYESYIKELTKFLPSGFKPKGKIFVFVDECHRTQSGKLHKTMKKILSDSLIIGFTGTPLLKKDKKKSIEVFGSYIHTYKYDEAVRDNMVLDLRYEARDIEQKITSMDRIDQWFDSKTRGLTEFAKDKLKKKWGNLKKVFSSKSRLEKIVADIMLDMETKERLQNGRGNALLVSGSIYQACRYYELFMSKSFEKCAIITSFVPTHASIKGEASGEGDTEKIEQYDIYQKMLNGKSVSVFEQEVKKKFVEEPGQMKLLIVVDKLLTGFDAPSATYLYIDKRMQDHGLFQAICRVNRLDGEDKEYGYIVDYMDLFKSLERSIEDYTSGAFEGYDKEDVEGLLTNRLTKGKEKLDDAIETINALCESVKPPRDSPSYIHYFCGSNTENPEELKDTKPRRITLYKATSKLIRAYANIANEMIEAGYTKEDINEVKNETKYYENVRKEIQLASGDYIDLKQYEPAMRHLIDTYIGAEESRILSTFDDLTLVELIVERGVKAIDELPENIRSKKEAVAETIENNLRKVIVEQTPTNPAYYGKMSILLDELIKLRKIETDIYEEYLKRIVELTKKISKPSSSKEYPKSLTTSAKRALYDNLNKDEKLALELDQVIHSSKRDDWRGNMMKERDLKIKIKKILRKHSIDDDKNFNKLFELVKNQSEY